MVRKAKDEYLKMKRKISTTESQLKIKNEVETPLNTPAAAPEANPTQGPPLVTNKPESQQDKSQSCILGMFCSSIARSTQCVVLLLISYLVVHL